MGRCRLYILARRWSRRYNSPVRIVCVRADPHRSRGRHHRHLAAVSVSRRRHDAERRHQPARARDRRARADGGSSSSRSTPAARSGRATGRSSSSANRAAAAGAARPSLPTRERDADDPGRIARRRRHRRLVSADDRHVRRAGPLHRAHRRTPEDLLQVAMNVECQTIRVPTGRPGLSSGAVRRRRRHRARRRRHPPRRHSTSIRASSSAASSSPTPARRAIPARTTGRSPSAISTATVRSSTASSAFAIPPRACATALRAGDWDEVGRQIATNGTTRKRLAPGVTTPAIETPDRRGDCAPAPPPPRCAAPAAAAACSATVRLQPRQAIAEALAAGGARLLDYRIEIEGFEAWITWRSPACSGRSPICWKSRTTTRSRFARTATAPTSSPITRTIWPCSTPPALREIPGIGKDLAARIRRDGHDRRIRVPPRAASRNFRPRSSTCCIFRGRPEDRRDALSRARHPDARGSRGGLRARSRAGAERHGREERSAHPEGTDRSEAATRAATCWPTRTRSRRRSSSMLRGTGAGGADHARRQPAPRMRDLRRHRHSRLRRGRRR